ncbi:conserved hypothetical protein [uncultured Paludibacter sp.]|nr:conserved hypothetical protein [uncultured Paludibacter sp.]
MLKYIDYDIVFQEIPDEVTLAINLTNCPHRCIGCHSSHLCSDIGEVLEEKNLSQLLQKYSDAITCVCFMGGDSDPKEVCRLSNFVLRSTDKKIKTAWYSGFNKLNDPTYADSFNYIKLGEYMEKYGGLNKTTTNQRLYKIENGEMIDITVNMQE